MDEGDFDAYCVQGYDIDGYHIAGGYFDNFRRAMGTGQITAKNDGKSAILRHKRRVNRPAKSPQGTTSKTSAILR